MCTTWNTLARGGVVWVKIYWCWRSKIFYLWEGSLFYFETGGIHISFDEAQIWDPLQRKWQPPRKNKPKEGIFSPYELRPPDGFLLSICSQAWCAISSEYNTAAIWFFAISLSYSLRSSVNTFFIPMLRCYYNVFIIKDFIIIIITVKQYKI